MQLRISPVLPFAEERWRPIPGFPGYDASDLGRVRSWRRAIGGHAHLMVPSKRKGYLLVRLRDETGHSRVVTVGSLVLEAFVGKRPKGAVCCHHPDPNRSSNHLSNLRWGTRAENGHDALRDGHVHGQKVKLDFLPSLWARLVDGERVTEVARAFGLSVTTVSNIRNYHHWSHITRKLPGIPPGVEITAPTSGPITAPKRMIDSIQEVWRPVKGWSHYRVSNFGRLLSCWPSRGKRGILPWRKARVLEPNVRRDGYVWACLTNPDGKKQVIAVHVLVLTAFAGPRPPRMYACHKDGDRSNNHVANLRWDTQSANMVDRSRQGRANSPFSCADIKAIREALDAGAETKKIAERYGVSLWTIDFIRRRRSWSHVS